MLALKHVVAINTEQYNKLSIKCAFVCSLYIYVMEYIGQKFTEASEKTVYPPSPTRRRKSDKSLPKYMMTHPKDGTISSSVTS